MKNQTSVSASALSPGRPAWRRFLARPSTRLGWWSVVLAGVFVGVMIVGAFIQNSAAFMQLTADPSWRQTLMIPYGIFLLLSGLIAGIVGLVAVARRSERSWLVWLAILLGLFMFFLILFEFLVPH